MSEAIFQHSYRQTLVQSALRKYYQKQRHALSPLLLSFVVEEDYAVKKFRENLEVLKEKGNRALDLVNENMDTMLEVIKLLLFASEQVGAEGTRIQYTIIIQTQICNLLKF
jgi:hypothetical protein